MDSLCFLGYAHRIPVHIFLYIHLNLLQKKKSLPFGGLITKIAIMVKIPLHDIELIVKVYGKISVITFIKSEGVIRKTWSWHKESTSSQLETPQINPLLLVVIKQL
jgi:hypothetical protein